MYKLGTDKNKKTSAQNNIDTNSNKMAFTLKAAEIVQPRAKKPEK
jgi:hypothetical protein